MLSYSVLQIVVIKIPGYLMRTPHYRLSGPERKRTFCDPNECWYMRQAMRVIKGFLKGLLNECWCLRQAMRIIKGFLKGLLNECFLSSSGAQRASGLSVH